MNKVVFLLLLFTKLSVYANDSIFVDKIWTERRTIFYNKEEMVFIGEDSLIEDYGIACGYFGCKEIFFFSNHQFKKIYPDGRICLGKWGLKDDLLTIVYNKRERGKKKKDKYKVKYREKEECPTFYLFERKGRVRACYIFCNYK